MSVSNHDFDFDFDFDFGFNNAFDLARHSSAVVDYYRPQFGERIANWLRLLVLHWFPCFFHILQINITWTNTILWSKKDQTQMSKGHFRLVLQIFKKYLTKTWPKLNRQRNLDHAFGAHIINVRKGADRLEKSVRLIYFCHLKVSVGVSG